MSRIASTLMDKVSFNENGSTPIADLSLGGQFGYQMNPGAFISNSGYVPRNLIPILFEPPRGLYDLPNPEKSIAVLRALIENQSKQITGLRSGLTVESSERQISHAGHMQKDPVKVTEEISVPNHVWDERAGRSIHNYWQWYIRNLIGEPITQQPGVMSINPDIEIMDGLADYYSFTTLYIEPDASRKHAVASWLVPGMYPGAVTALESQFDISGSPAIPEIAIEFAGIPISSEGVMILAQETLDKLNYVNAGPMQRAAFIDSIAADIAASANGYVEDVATAAASGIG